MNAYHIHVEGQVQGVGFRPFVWRLAKQFGLSGWVSNGVDGVHIEIVGDELSSRKFYLSVVQQAPINARIIKHSITEIGPKNFNDFQIRESSNEGQANLLITPDISLCEACRQEILTKENRRYNYAFTTCTHCGPRYSIMQHLPYDRANTTMSVFPICDQCLLEYNDSSNRRYYSQTNSCPHCAIELYLCDSSGKKITDLAQQVVSETAKLLMDGKIVALKGIGGYLLLCDATNAAVISLLRERKHRPAKPFAVLYPSLDSVSADTQISSKESDTLLSAEAPIVLLKAKPNPSVALEAIAPHLNRIGVMLPYTPLMLMLMQAYNKPLVATSANESGSPIFFEDDQALEQLHGIADYFVVNTREIVVPQDDSVVQFTKEKHKIILRRSRGMAPTFLPHSLSRENKTWLAMGGDLKSSFALLNQNNVYISQYLGDLENYQTQEAFKHTLDHWQKLLRTTPHRVIIDKHPVYFSSTLGNRMTSLLKVPLVAVQHHQAHLCAVLAENDLLESDEPVLGVIWDGTGWGDDGNIWGGEFFRYELGKIDRVVHLDYFDHFLGDKVSREPRLCALSLCKEIKEAEEFIRPKFTPTEWNLYNKILSQPDLLKSSSMGRLFDGIASLLGLSDHTTYEGEAALYLETLASQAEEVELPRARWMEGKDFSLRTNMRQLIGEIKAGTPKENIAFQFHLSLVRWIAKVAAQQKVKRLAFSGGVFQNALLVHLIQKHLSDQFTLYFHHQLSPNDECIGFGQLAWQYIQKHVKPEAVSQKQKSEEVLITR